MRFAQYQKDGQRGVGLVRGISLTPLSGPVDMLQLIQGWGSLADTIPSCLTAESFNLADAQLLPPITRPGKILAIGLNYRDHIEESGLTTPEHQTWFCKQPSAINGPYDPVEMPKVSSALDYEVELVAVIGRAGRHISRDEAPTHVFGYCVGNDVSVRDWQLRTPQWMLGKSFDTHAPIGPWIVTGDEIVDPHALDIISRVNGEIRQQSNTRHLLFDLWDQIAHLSDAMTLEPGDLIFTGTPAGVGFGFDPPRPLCVGDVVRCEISGIGDIENRVVAEG